MDCPVVLQSPLMMVRRHGDIHIIEFLDNNLVSPMTIERVRQQIEEVIDRAAAPKLVVSFDHVTHISSALLGVLISAHQRATALGGGVRLAGVPDNVIAVLKLAQVHKRLALFDQTEQALVNF